MYRIRHPITAPNTFVARISPRRMLHDLGWMRVMVSSSDAREVFGRAFSRPPRLLFTNPVAFMFSAYYAYIYGEHFIIAVSAVERLIMSDLRDSDHVRLTRQPTLEFRIPAIQSDRSVHLRMATTYPLTRIHWHG